MKYLLFAPLCLLLVCRCAFAQLPPGVTSIPNTAGNECATVPQDAEALRLLGPSKAAIGSDVTICFVFEGNRSDVSYFRVRQSQVPAGPYFQWGRLPADSTGMKFKMPSKTIYLYLTTVGMVNGSVIETAGSTQILLEPQ